MRVVSAPLTLRELQDVVNQLLTEHPEMEDKLVETCRQGDVIVLSVEDEILGL